MLTYLIDTMGVCFICDTKLNSGSKCVCSSITQYGNVPYPKKIAELLGDKVVVIVKSADMLCSKCDALMNLMDSLEHELKLVKNEIVIYIQNKYALSSHFQAFEDDEVKIKHN